MISQDSPIYSNHADCQSIETYEIQQSSNYKHDWLSKAVVTGVKTMYLRYSEDIKNVQTSQQTSYCTLLPG